jgi:ribosomal RNA assembly protein
MQQILIPAKRASTLRADGKILAYLASRTACRIEVSGENLITLEGDTYGEYNARNVIVAYGRGFSMKTAMKLLADDCFFSQINLKDSFSKKDRIRMVKARLIGTEGKTKKYISEISGADISIYGSSIGLIGTEEGIKLATVAIDLILEGGTHKKAYMAMERLRKKMRRESITQFRG